MSIVVVHPLRIDLCQYGFSSVAIYKRSNIFAFSGSSRAVKYKSSTVGRTVIGLWLGVHLWRFERLCARYSCVFQCGHSCEYPIRLVLLEWEFECSLNVVLDTETHIYHLKDLSLIKKVPTFSNPKGYDCTIYSFIGLACTQLRNGCPIFCLLGEKKGYIRVIVVDLSCIVV